MVHTLTTLQFFSDELLKEKSDILKDETKDLFKLKHLVWHDLRETTYPWGRFSIQCWCIWDLKQCCGWPGKWTSDCNGFLLSEWTINLQDFLTLVWEEQCLLYQLPWLQGSGSSLLAPEILDHIHKNMSRVKSITR